MADFPADISTDGIRLRPLCDADLPIIVKQLSDPAISCWLATVAQPFGLADALELKDHGQAAGECLRVIEVDGVQAGCFCLGAGLWYWLDRSFHGRGVMTVALTEAISAWFTDATPPLRAVSRTDNAASRNLLTRLGFSQSPKTRRMFFRGSGQAEDCYDYVMAPEQWHLLHPPTWKLGSLTLRPARQMDSATLARMLPARSDVLPGPEVLPRFIEEHRVRIPQRGLFVIEDKTTRCIGMALVTRDAAPVLRFLSDDESKLHEDALMVALSNGLSDERP